jgi:hypothetical protein
MRLSSPSIVTIIVSVVLALAGILARLGMVHLPLSSSGAGYLAAAYVLLLAGNFVRGL